MAHNIHKALVWKELEVLDELIAADATSLDEETAAAVDAGLAACEDRAYNNGIFVSCAKMFLKPFKSILLKADYDAIQKAINKSDIGKTATEVIREGQK